MKRHRTDGRTSATDTPDRDGELRVCLTDVWNGGDSSSNPVTSLLIGQPTANWHDVRTADVVLCSVFGHRHLSAKGTVVGFSAEAEPLRGAPHFSIDCRHRPDPSHLRLPPWAFMTLLHDEPLHAAAPLDDATQRRFCNFIYRNPMCSMRNAFFEALHQHQPVDSLGSLYHNRADPRLSKRDRAEWRRSKIEVLRSYRFTIAFENVETVGYTTEKIVDAWLADSVPIYWGNPAHTVDFPPGSYLSLYEAGSMTKLIDQVLEAEHEPQRYAELRANNPFRTGHAQLRLDTYRRELTEFVELIRADAIERRSRPPIGPIGNAQRAARRIRQRITRRTRNLLVP